MNHVTVASGSNRLTYSSDISHSLGFGRSKATLRLASLLQSFTSEEGYHTELSYLGNLDSRCLAMGSAFNLLSAPPGDFDEIVLQNDKFALVLFQVWLMHHKCHSDHFTITLFEDRLDLYSLHPTTVAFVECVHYVNGQELNRFPAKTAYAGSTWAQYASAHLLGMNARSQIQRLMASYNQHINKVWSGKHYAPLQAWVDSSSFGQKFLKDLQASLSPEDILKQWHLAINPAREVVLNPSFYSSSPCGFGSKLLNRRKRKNANHFQSQAQQETQEHSSMHLKPLDCSLHR